MAFRFRRTINLLPGLRINFSKGGVGLSVGKRGVSVTMGRRGMHLNLGLPRTGLSYGTKLGGSKGGFETRVATKAEAKPSLIVPDEEFEFGLTKHLTLSVIDTHSGNALSKAAANKYLVAANRSLARIFLEDQAEARNAAIRSFGAPHLTTAAQDPLRTFLLHDGVLSSLPAEPLRSSKPLHDGSVAKLSATQTAQVRQRTRAALRGELEVSQPGDEALEAWSEYSQSASALRRRKYDLRKQLLECSETAFSDYVQRALKGVRWPTRVTVSPTTQKSGERIVLSYNVTLPQLEDMPEQEFEVDHQGYILVRSALKVEGRKSLWRCYAKAVTATLLTVSFNLSPRVGTVQVTAKTAEPSRVVVRGMPNMHTTLSREQFEWERQALFADPLLLEFSKQDWAVSNPND
jgi:hypothetical protein